jgi:chemotaxis protein MotB
MAKKKRKEEHENHERWLVSYADFITLLFAFFTVLYATAHRDLEKERQFEGSIKKAFKAAVQMGGGQGDGGLYVGPKKGSLVPPAIQLFPPQGAGPNELLDANGKSRFQKTKAKAKRKAHFFFAP